MSLPASHRPMRYLTSILLIGLFMLLAAGPARAETIADGRGYTERCTMDAVWNLNTDPFSLVASADVTMTNGDCTYNDVRALIGDDGAFSVGNDPGAIEDWTFQMRVDLAGPFAATGYAGAVTGIMYGVPRPSHGAVAIANGQLNADLGYGHPTIKMYAHASFVGTGRCGQYCFETTSTWAGGLVSSSAG